MAVASQCPKFDEIIGRRDERSGRTFAKARVCVKKILVALEWNVVVCGVPSSKLARKRWKCVGFLCGWVVGRRPHHATAQKGV